MTGTSNKPHLFQKGFRGGEIGVGVGEVEDVDLEESGLRAVVGCCHPALVTLGAFDQDLHVENILRIISINK